jgi:hypothetical protein
MAYLHLQTITLATAAAAIEFTSIPQTGRDLIAKFSLRAASGDFQLLAMTINDNAASTSYTSQRLFTRDTGSTFPDAQAESDSSTSLSVGRIPGSGAASGLFGIGQISINDYTRTNTKAILTECSYNDTVSAIDKFYTGLGGGTHAGETSVTGLEFFVPSVNLVAGSTISLYIKE